MPPIGLFCQAVLRIIFIPIIVFANRVVAAKPIDVRLVENDPEDVLINVRCVSEGVFTASIFVRPHSITQM